MTYNYQNVVCYIFCWKVMWDLLSSCWHFAKPFHFVIVVGFEVLAEFDKCNGRVSFNSCFLCLQIKLSLFISKSSFLKQQIQQDSHLTNFQMLEDLIQNWKIWIHILLLGPITNLISIFATISFPGIHNWNS